MSPQLLSLALFTAIAASTLAEGFGPHRGFYGGPGDRWGAAPFYGSNTGQLDRFARGEKSDWSEYKYGGHEAHASGESYGRQNEGYGSDHGFNPSPSNGYGYAGEPRGFYGAYGPHK